MSNELINIYNNILIEDLKSYLKGLEKNDYGFCNIISNRLITDAVILESKKYTLIGTILKDVTFDYRFFENKKIALDDAKENLHNMVEDFLENKNESDINYILSKYSEYYNEFRKIITSEMEVYEENKSFSIYITKYILNTFKDEIKNQEMPHNLDVLVYGILSEFNRIIRTFGFVSQQLILKTLLSFFGRLSEYFRYILISESKIEKWKKLYFEYKEKLTNNIESFEINDEYIKSTVNLIFEVCREWRFMFIRLLELPKPQFIEKSFSMPEIVKEDLREMVSDLISSKLEGENK